MLSSMMPTSQPLAESMSIAALSKSAHQALAEVETHAHAEVARATADARDARTARDKAISESQAWKQEAASCKASLKQAELTISHQAETIAQLRREANQWRDQSRNWQEHFLRVEQEKCSLNTRIEELASENLQRGQAVSAPFYPRPLPNCVASAPSTIGRAPSSSHPPAYKSAPPATPEDHTPPTSISAHKTSRSVPKPLERPLHNGELPVYQAHNPRTVQAPRKRKSRSPLRPEPRVIRRVQAVIAVKQEESDDDSVPSEMRNKKGNSQNLKPCVSIRKRQQALFRNDDQAGSSPDASDGSAGGALDVDEQEDSDDQDELMLVAEPAKISTKSLPRPRPSDPPALPPNKKRKPPIRRKA